MSIYDETSIFSNEINIIILDISWLQLLVLPNFAFDYFENINVVELDSFYILIRVVVIWVPFLIDIKFIWEQVIIMIELIQLGQSHHRVKVFDCFSFV